MHNLTTIENYANNYYLRILIDPLVTLSLSTILEILLLLLLSPFSFRTAISKTTVECFSYYR